MKRFVVTGYAYVPVQIRIMVDAADESTAGFIAQNLFDNSTMNRSKFIVPGSEDEAAVHDFRWSEVQVIRPSGKSPKHG